MFSSWQEPPPLRTPSTPSPSPAAAQILTFLAGNERQVGEIVIAIGLDQPSVSKHLGVLRKVGLVHVRRNGRHRLYRTNAEAIRPVHEWTRNIRALLAPPTDPGKRARRSGDEAQPATRVTAQYSIARFAIVSRPTKPSSQGETMTTLTATEIENLTLRIEQEIRVKASLEITFAALLEQLGPLSEKPDGTPMHMVIEALARRTLVPRPGQWRRPLLGHCSGHQKAHAAGVQRAPFYVLSRNEQRAVPSQLRERRNPHQVRHAGFGLVQDEHSKGVVHGWSYIHEQVRRRAEGRDFGRSLARITVAFPKQKDIP